MGIMHEGSWVMAMLLTQQYLSPLKCCHKSLLPLLVVVITTPYSAVLMGLKHTHVGATTMASLASEMRKTSTRQLWSKHSMVWGSRASVVVSITQWSALINTTYIRLGETTQGNLDKWEVSTLLTDPWKSMVSKLRKSAVGIITQWPFQRMIDCIAGVEMIVDS